MTPSGICEIMLNRFGEGIISRKFTENAAHPVKLVNVSAAAVENCLTLIES